MNVPSISVAMCTRNGSAYLPEQLRSMARQTVAPDEFVVCDDASTDTTSLMVRQFALSSGVPVRLVRNSAALGCTRNFERAIGLCAGDIIVLADQDDIWKPNKLAAIRQAFAENSAAAYAFSDADLVNEAGTRLALTLWETVGLEPALFTPARQVEMLLKRNLVTGAAMSFRASLRQIVLPIPPEWRHDYWIALLGSVFGFGVPLPQRLFFYRRHLAQQVGSGKDTLATRIGTSLAAEPDYYAKAARMAELLQRVSARGSPTCPAAHLQLIRQKEFHLARRALIRSSRGGSRIAQLAREAASGRYQQFSYSWASMIRDLVAAVPLR